MASSLVLSLVIGGVFVGCFSFAVFGRFLGIMQQEHYKSGAYLKWYFKRGNITRQRVELLSLSLLLLLSLFNVCFSSPGYQGANLTALAPFLFLFFFYYLVQEKHALKVKTAVTPRVIRLGVCTFLFVSVLSVGICLGMAALADFANMGWLYLLRFVPVSLVPLVAPLVLALANAFMSVFETVNGKRYIKKAKKILEESDCIKVGITGSFGKTSVKNFAKTILSERFQVIATPASYNTPLGIARTVNEQGVSCNIFLAEMGARYRGDISELCEIVQPTYGVVTGICNQHLETFQTLENIRAEKGVLAEYCTFAVLGKSAEGLAEGEGVFVEDKDFGARNIVLGTEGTSFDLQLGGQTIPVKTRLLGRHAAEDIALAAALAYLLGEEIDTIAKGIAKIEPVEHRLQLLQGVNGVNVLDDAYNSNVAGASNALEVLRLFKGEKFVVTPGIVELGEMRNEENEKLGAGLVGFNVILVGETLVKSVHNGYIAAGGDAERIVTVPTLQKAQELLAQRLKQGDTVLFLNDLPDAF